MKNLFVLIVLFIVQFAFSIRAVAENTNPPPADAKPCVLLMTGPLQFYYTPEGLTKLFANNADIHHSVLVAGDLSEKSRKIIIEMGEALNLSFSEMKRRMEEFYTETNEFYAFQYTGNEAAASLFVKLNHLAKDMNYSFQDLLSQIVKVHGGFYTFKEAYYRRRSLTPEVHVNQIGLEEIYYIFKDAQSKNVDVRMLVPKLLSLSWEYVDQGVVMTHRELYSLALIPFFYENRH
jgi:hypothetical protein